MRCNSVRGDADLAPIRWSIAFAEFVHPDWPVLRLPSWISAAIRPGLLVALLVEGLAGKHTRIGRPLWVPIVGPERVRFLRDFPEPIRVDGPGVLRNSTIA